MVSSRTLFEMPGRIRVDAEAVRLPDGRVIDDYLQVRMGSFSVVYAETDDESVVCLRQYKHGPKCVSLTLPAGHLDAGESPIEAAKRELLEETGFEAQEYRLLGSFVVNGNQGCGTAHVIWANRCHQV